MRDGFLPELGWSMDDQCANLSLLYCVSNSETMSVPQQQNAEGLPVRGWGWLSGRMLAYQAGNHEFYPQRCQEKKKKKRHLSLNASVTPRVPVQ